MVDDRKLTRWEMELERKQTELDVCRAGYHALKATNDELSRKLDDSQKVAAHWRRKAMTVRKQNAELKKQIDELRAEQHRTATARNESIDPYEDGRSNGNDRVG